MCRRGLSAHASDNRMAKKPARPRKPRPAAPLPLPSAHAPTRTSPSSESAHQQEASRHLPNSSRGCLRIRILRLFSSSTWRRTTELARGAPCRPYAAAGGRSDRRRAHRGQSRVRGPPNVQMELVDGHLHLGRRPEDRTTVQPRSTSSSGRSPPPGSMRSASCCRAPRRTARSACARSSDGRHHVRAGSRHGEIRRHAAQRVRDADGRLRAAARRDRGQSSAQIAKHPYLAPPASREASRRSPTSSFVASSPAAPRVRRRLQHYKSPTIVRRLSAPHGVCTWSSGERLHQPWSRRRRGAPALTGHAHPRHPLLPRARVVRRARAATCSRRSSSTARAHRFASGCAGCATGEEAYSLAIALLRIPGRRSTRRPRADLRHRRQRERDRACARRRCTRRSIADDVSPERLRRFFAKRTAAITSPRRVRDMCVFARQDLTRDPPFSQLDLMMLPQRADLPGPAAATEAAVDVSLRAEAGRVPVLGHAETHRHVLGSVRARSNKKHKIYRKKAGGADGAAHGRVSGRRSGAGSRRVAGAARQRRPRLVQKEANRHHHSSGTRRRRAGRSAICTSCSSAARPGLTSSRRRRASFNILKMAREGLLAACAPRSAARKKRKPVAQAGCACVSGDGMAATSIWKSCRSSGSGTAVLPGAVRDAERTGAKRQGAQAAARREKQGRAAERRISSSEDELAATPRVPAVDRFRRSKRPTKSCSRRTRRFSRATKSCRAPTKSSTRPKKSCSRPTRSSTR